MRDPGFTEYHRMLLKEGLRRPHNRKFYGLIEWNVDLNFLLILHILFLTPLYISKHHKINVYVTTLWIFLLWSHVEVNNQYICNSKQGTIFNALSGKIACLLKKNIFDNNVLYSVKVNNEHI